MLKSDCAISGCGRPAHFLSLQPFNPKEWLLVCLIHTSPSKGCYARVYSRRKLVALLSTVITHPRLRHIDCGIVAAYISLATEP